MMVQQSFFLVIYDKQLARDEVTNLRSKCLGEQQLQIPLYEPRQLAITYHAAYNANQITDVNSFVCFDESELTMLTLCETPSYIGTWTEAELFGLVSYCVSIVEVRELKEAVRTMILNSESLRKTYSRLGISGAFPTFDETETLDTIGCSEENLLEFVYSFFEERRVQEPALQN